LEHSEPWWCETGLPRADSGFSSALMAPFIGWRGRRHGESNRLPARSLPRKNASLSCRCEDATPPLAAERAAPQAQTRRATRREAPHPDRAAGRSGLSTARSQTRQGGGKEYAERKKRIFLMAEDRSLPSDAPAPRISVVVPARNEAGNIAPLLEEIVRALCAFAPHEIIYVNDGSRDDTEAELQALMRVHRSLRQIKHAVSCGQSAAVRTGVTAARAPIVATLDGDGQNDPAFLPALVTALERDPAVGLVAGQRVGRRATGFKRFQSRVANAARRAILRDGTRDTGCGLKAFRREVFLALPYFDAVHRFLPALVRREGYKVAYVDVVDRPRLHGVSNYGLWDRLWVGILDLAGVWWLLRRRKRVPLVSEVSGDAG
jgi:dolichol-phosphate mannosyltransferase